MRGGRARRETGDYSHIKFREEAGLVFVTPNYLNNPLWSRKRARARKRASEREREKEKEREREMTLSGVITCKHSSGTHPAATV
jgi:hypothetical protein